MKYLIRGEKIQVTDSIKDYIQEKLSKMDKYLDNPENVEAKILIKVKGVEQRVEVTIQTKGYFLRAEEAHSDLYAAIDLIIDKLEREYKLKVNTKKTKIVNNREGFSFLGYLFKVIDKKIIIKIKKSNIDKVKKKVKQVRYLLDNNKISYNRAFSSVMTYSKCYKYSNNIKVLNIIDRYFYNEK